jgi:transcription initiation factor IIE alpha subunit
LWKVDELTWEEVAQLLNYAKKLNTLRQKGSRILKRLKRKYTELEQSGS